ncbi:hypothetical protein GCM10011348_36070 [Marinobacterium nitratireducens]|uniref:Uncharacterized protein n=1 Tax=Marinobacterium nitratireducens TaxID=518897 RepID=A0A918DX66_9GAMM|nr:hypothetical protein [Marinobacterium nitratireducens]GGO86074.1 hypothetical protein GCM10011348_36070 [Marinobacterium nitratireducens]
MSGTPDSRDKRQARLALLAIVVLLVVLGAAALLLLPQLAQIVETSLEPGLGLKNAAVISFFVTVALMLVFAIAAGDGFIGEIQFMLAGFGSFFVVIWLMLAWIF